MTNYLKRYFGQGVEDFSIRTEVLAGFTTFMTMMYIIVVNPDILGNHTQMPYTGVLTATILVSALSSIAMGLYANNPIALAPGMGLNAFFVYGVVLGQNIDWRIALGIVFWSGIIAIILSLSKVRDIIAQAIPNSLKSAIAVGIGFFIAFIGLVQAGVIISSEDTLVKISTLGAKQVLFWIGLCVSAFLLIKKIPGALIVGIILTTLLSTFFGRVIGTEKLVNWNGIFSTPNFELFLQFDILSPLAVSFVPVVFAFLFTDMIDSISLFIGVAEASNLKDASGQPKNMKKALLVDSLSTTISGIFGTSSSTSYIESAAGIGQGGRTGLTAVVCGLCFLPFLFFAPLISVVPSFATAPTLVLVGVFMAPSIKNINWSDYEESIPAFIVMILIPLTYSITNGIIWGFLSWTVLKILSGKWRQLNIGIVIIDLISVLALLR
ncbi:MAG: NCS2 family permease [Saprospiraceae bacterium]|nr:NCS2 family permease [Saprospiraceae bacterium]